LYPHKSGAASGLRNNHPPKTKSDNSTNIQSNFFNKRNQTNQVKKRMEIRGQVGSEPNAKTHIANKRKISTN